MDSEVTKTMERALLAADKRAQKKIAKRALQERVGEMRAAGHTWDEICISTGVSINKVVHLQRLNELDQEDMIPTSDKAELAKRIVLEKTENKRSWGWIMAHTGMAESRLRKMYEQETGVSSVGIPNENGGRRIKTYEEKRAAKKEKVRKDAESIGVKFSEPPLEIEPSAELIAALEDKPEIDASELLTHKPSQIRSVDAEPEPEPEPEYENEVSLSDMDAQELHSHLLGKVLTINVNGKMMKAKVVELEVDGTTLTITGSKGGKAEIELGDILEVSNA